MGFSIGGIMFYGLANQGPVTAAAASFQCRYLANIQVASKEFTAISAKAVATQAGYGSINEAFALQIFTDDQFAEEVGSQLVYIGSRLYTSVDFTVESLETSVTFFIESCNLVIGEVSVAIVKDECYSKALRVQSEESSNISTRFSFTAMSTGQNAKDNSGNSVQCNLRICMKSNDACAAPTTCPADVGYQYSLNGH